MSVTLQFLEADAAERSVFNSLETLLALPSTPAAPPNRLRNVRRIETPDGRVYYLKIFSRTQAKNRLRNRLTAPHCRLDGEREAAVTAALQDRGWTTPRPILVAIDAAEGASYYLCATLPGTSIAELRRTGAWQPSDDDAVARFCGAVLASGVILPDLSADHVFVLPPTASAGPEYAVLDLHNGLLSEQITPRAMRRIFRRFSKSLRGLPTERPRAMRFALRLMRGAGFDRSARRATIRRTDPIDTHGRYDDGDRSQRYAERNSDRARRELALLDAVWPGRHGDTVLDAPCGAGRLQPFCEERGARWFGADRSAAMLKQTRERRLGTDGRTLLCDAQALPIADAAVDGVITFRFLHHLPPAQAQAAIAASTRCARRWVVVTFFHPVSAHGLSRRLRHWLSRTAVTRYAVWPATLRGWARECGFELTTLRAQSRYRRDFWIAVLERR